VVSPAATRRRVPGGGRSYSCLGSTSPVSLDAGHLAPPTCAIIATNANELLVPIHNRMPVILDPDDEAIWFDPGPIAPVKVLPCLRAFPSARWKRFPYRRSCRHRTMRGQSSSSLCPRDSATFHTCRSVFQVSFARFSDRSYPLGIVAP